MSTSTNTHVVLQRYAPKDVHSPDFFSVERSQPIPDASLLKPGQVLVRVEALSIDPHQRRFIDSLEGQDFGNAKPFVYPLGQPITGIGAGVVISSSSNQFTVGDRVRSDDIPWQTYAVVADNTLTKLPQSSLPLSDYIGVLGMPAFTAYLGVVMVGQPKVGETLLVSAASGAVGQIVVQLAKVRGLRVIGAAGSDDKVSYVKSLGADAVLNYRTCGDFVQALGQIAPKGIDIYFDNVGGEFLDAALLHLNTHARVVICGSMSTYAVDKAKISGIKNLDTLIVKEVTLRSIFYLLHVGTTIEEEFLQEMTQLVEQGLVKFKTDVREGLEHAPQALADLFTGDNFGKLIVKTLAAVDE
ncbi:hypothetical protein H4R24_000966 [Coemansia sp. RSA 988]|nr:hypothetical protein H4R24_000966 [Coemansia sp. RSA 988]